MGPAAETSIGVLHLPQITLRPGSGGGRRFIVPQEEHFTIRSAAAMAFLPQALATVDVSAPLDNTLAPGTARRRAPSAWRAFRNLHARTPRPARASRRRVPPRPSRR